ncbi:hypothetical protein QBC34DRAFT_428976 [Podospora aff. communis PSN243]|uniref:Uncharacterized protein n=1 Tax=Podospora aff. communis PSN243 TaxID=3040156 RepID=A0AAV9GBR8_9PEZI|nr:hypothetical protein QBC34DRAFT_428976 [Podospora aff. communis PSN243]
MPSVHSTHTSSDDPFVDTTTPLGFHPKVAVVGIDNLPRTIEADLAETMADSLDIPCLTANTSPSSTRTTNTNNDGDASTGDGTPSSRSSSPSDDDFQSDDDADEQLFRSARIDFRFPRGDDRADDSLFLAARIEEGMPVNEKDCAEGAGSSIREMLVDKISPTKLFLLRKMEEGKKKVVTYKERVEKMKGIVGMTRGEEDDEGEFPLAVSDDEVELLRE